MKLLIGVTGEKGSGKGTFARFLCEIAPSEISIRSMRFSDLLVETLEAWRIPTTRANLQRLSIAMDKEFGAGVLATAVRHRIQDDPSDVVILDGVRWQAEVKMIRGFPSNILVYVVVTNPLTRFKRLQGRGKYVGEDTMNFEQFLQEEGAATEVLIPEIGKRADFRACNDGTLEEFLDTVKSFYDQHIAAHRERGHTKKEVE